MGALRDCAVLRAWTVAKSPARWEQSNSWSSPGCSVGNRGEREPRSQKLSERALSGLADRRFADDLSLRARRVPDVVQWFAGRGIFLFFGAFSGSGRRFLAELLDIVASRVGHGPIGRASDG